MQNQMRSLIVVPLILFSMILWSGCTRNEGCTDPSALNYDAEVTVDNGTCEYLVPQPQLSLSFNYKLGEADFGYGATALTWEGRKVQFTLAQFYVSKINMGQTSFPDRYLLVTLKDPVYAVGSIEAGTFSTLSFNVGVDEEVNHLDPAIWPSVHALSSNQIDHAHWGWNPGYIFLKMEGRVDTTADMTGTANAAFSIHIGLDSLLTNVVLPDIMNISGDTALTIKMDWLRLLDNIDLRLNRSTDSFNNPSLASAVRANIPSAFALE